MKRIRLQHLKPFALPAAIALVSALSGYAAAGALAYSEDIDFETEEARARLEQAEVRLTQLASRPKTSATLCQGSPVTAQTVLEGRLSETATRTGVAWRDTQFQVDGGAGYAVLRFRTTAEGSYEAVIQALNQLAAGSPTIFTERLDIGPSAAGVHAELEGGQVCLTAPA